MALHAHHDAQLTSHPLHTTPIMSLRHLSRCSFFHHSTLDHPLSPPLTSLLRSEIGSPATHVSRDRPRVSPSSCWLQSRVSNRSTHVHLESYDHGCFWIRYNSCPWSCVKFLWSTLSRCSSLSLLRISVWIMHRACAGEEMPAAEMAGGW